MPKQNKSLLQYAGLATTMFVFIGGGVWLGIKVDHWAGLRTPIATWLLPLLILTGILIGIVRDTGTKK
jgi:hypothetical protein